MASEVDILLNNEGSSLQETWYYRFSYRERAKRSYYQEGIIADQPVIKNKYIQYYDIPKQRVRRLS